MIMGKSPIQDYVHPDDQTQPTFEMTPGFKPFTIIIRIIIIIIYSANLYMDIIQLLRNN